MTRLPLLALSFAVTLAGLGLAPFAPAAAATAPSGGTLQASRAVEVQVAASFARPSRNSRAVCLSTDGLKVCDCGTLDCVARATSCDCLKPPPPPAPNPAPQGPRLRN